MNSKSRLGAICILVGSFLYVTALVGAAPLVVTLDAEPFAGELVAIGAAGVLTFREIPLDGDAVAVAGSSVSDTLRDLTFDKFVRWGHPVNPRPQTLLVLADGGRLMGAAAWAGGAPVRLDGDSIVVLTDIWDEMRLPRGLVLGVVFAQQTHPQDRERLENVVRADGVPAAATNSPDTVMLTNKDRLTGKLQNLSGGSLELTTDAGTVKLPLSRVEAIILGRAAGDPSRIPSSLGSGKFAIGFRDGSLLYARSATANEKNLSLVLASGLNLDGGSVKEVTFLQSLGGRFVYLSDLEPAGYRHVPYLSIEWPYQRDANVMGEPLVVDGNRYLKGIGMHSAARLTYRLDQLYKRFDAAVAVDDSAARRGSVTFGVYLLRDGHWKEAYMSGPVRGGEELRPVSVDVSGTDGLSLTVDFADRGDELDRADWLDARLVK